MKIQSQVLAGPQLAKLEKQLDKGVVPQDVFEFGGQLTTGGLGAPLQPQRPGVLAQAPVVAVTGATGALMGSLLGMSIMPPTFPSFISPAGVAGAVLGAAVGIGFAFEGGLPFRGKTEIELDGQKSLETWRGRPNLRAESPAELKTRLTAVGALGDSIEPVQPKLEGPADLSKVQPYKTQLQELAHDRRLVADLGGLSRYGKPALQLVDSSLAAQVLARGGGVFAVTRTEQRDVPHVLKTNAISSERSEVTAATHQYVDRQFSYSLTPLSQPIPAGEGVPEGLEGVLKEEGTFTQPVLRQVDAGHRHVTKESESKHLSQQKSSRDGSVTAEKTNVAARLSQAMATSTKPTMISAAIVGGMAAGMAGVPPMVGLIAGGALGHLAGRASIAAEPGSATRTIVRGALGVGGAFAGVAAGLHAGLHGGMGVAHGPLAAGLAAGAFGGLALGAIWDIKHGKTENFTTAHFGFVAGAALGIATAVSGSPYLGVATAALGAVGGVCLGRLAPT